MAFVPTKDAEFAAWADNLMGITEAHQEEFHIPPEQFTPLKGLHTAFKAAYAKVLEPNRGGGDAAALYRIGVYLHTGSNRQNGGTASMRRTIT